MPHPGRIVYSHPPNTDGVSYFYITYHQRNHRCELRCADMDGEKRLVEAHMLDLLETLESGTVEGAQWDEEASRRAAKAIRNLAQRRHLL